MTRAWDKEKKIWVPDGNRTHDLPNTGRTLYPLSHDNSWRAEPCKNWLYVSRVLHTARNSMSSSGSVVRTPARCLRGHGFDSRWILRFFLCPSLVSCWLFHLFITLSPSLNATIIYFIIIYQDSAVPSSMQDACHIWTQFLLIASLCMSSRGSVDRAPDRCSRGHGLDSRRGLRFFSAPGSCHVDYFIFTVYTVTNTFVGTFLLRVLRVQF